MSILAADKLAIAGLPAADVAGVVEQGEGRSIVHDYEKISVIASKTLALAIAGNTQDHYYLPEIKRCVGIDEVLWKIRRHQEGFVRFHDRSGLSALTSFTANQGIATYFDQDANTYFTNTYLFSPIEVQMRLHRGRDDVQILYAGSGSEPFKRVVGLEKMHAFKTTIHNRCTLDACIPWLQEVFRMVGASDPGSGAEPVVIVSTRANLNFSAIPNGG